MCIKNQTRYICIFLLSAFVFASGCKKYLEEKSDNKLFTPSTLPELQSMLDNYSVMNTGYCSGGEVSADNYYLQTTDYNALSNDYDQRMYVWAKSNLFPPGTDGNDWSKCYQAIYTANSVLENLEKIDRTPSNLITWDNLKGEALFFRGSRILDAAFIWTLAYDSLAASTELGLPLRLNTDFNQPSVRSSLQQTYDQVITDIKTSVALLPLAPSTIYRPSKAAAYGLLARAYLSVGDYEKSALSADSCLQYSNTLMDYNTLDTTSSYPITKFNSEALFYSTLSIAYPLYFSTPKIDSPLYKSYSSNDLRKSVFFADNNDGTYSFKGNYTGGYTLFNGIALDEIYLIRAESNARQNKLVKALEDLNTLLVKRWKAGTFIPVASTSMSAAVDLILQERRKELLMRGLRWPDIKRFNKAGANILVTRNINGQIFSLVPNDLRYALPIPEDVISQSNMQQNPR